MKRKTLRIPLLKMPGTPAKPEPEPKPGPWRPTLPLPKPREGYFEVDMGPAERVYRWGR